MTVKNFLIGLLKNEVEDYEIAVQTEDRDDGWIWTNDLYSDIDHYTHSIILW